MAKDEKKKGLFGKAVDALTSRDEKEAAEAAKKAENAAKVKAAAAAREAAKAKAAAEEAEAKLKEMEEKQEAQEKRAEMARKAEEWRKKQAEAQAKAAEAAKPKIIAEHVLTETETLSHLSLKYYGSAIRDYWMVIYEENKEEIGDNPAHVRVGMTIRIPELPEELKKD